jgi:peptidyl-prolyl cis-trans isomerase A (cyclophilin A)
VASELYATLTTSLGPVRIKLFPDHAPKTVRNFVGLSDGSVSGPTRAPAPRARARSTPAPSSTG